MENCFNPRCKEKFKFKKGKKYCSESCGYRYRALIYYKKYGNKWARENREKYNLMINKNYHKNKNNWKSRSTTYQILYNVNYDHNIDISRKCKHCESNKNLEIHHEEYPIIIKEIKNAICEGKIYFLCKDCHNKVTKSKPKGFYS
jgi:hypothetical protein